MEFPSQVVEFQEDAASQGSAKLTVDPAVGLYVSYGAYLMVEQSSVRARRISHGFFQSNACTITELGTGTVFRLGAGDVDVHSYGFMPLTETGLFFDPVIGVSFDYGAQTLALEMIADIVRFDPMLPSWLGHGNSGIGDKHFFRKAYPLVPGMRESISFRPDHVIEIACKSR